MSRWRKGVMTGPRVVGATAGDHVNRAEKRKGKSDKAKRTLTQDIPRSGLVQPVISLTKLSSPNVAGFAIYHGRLTRPVLALPGRATGAAGRRAGPPVRGSAGPARWPAGTAP